VDQLLSADVVVLARENPDKPFSYAIVEVLKGDLDEPDIDLFLDSTLRRRLHTNPERSVVLVRSVQARSAATARTTVARPVFRNPGGGEVPGTWRSIGYASAEYEALVRDILAQADPWRNRTSLDARGRYFLPYLSGPERSIRDLAYLEVSQASYDVIREADRFVPAEQLYEFLSDPLYFQWHPLFILLMGIEASPEEEDSIRAAVTSRARLDSTVNFAAWAAALIEVDGIEAVAWLEQTYLGDASRSPESVMEVFKALSMHGGRERGVLHERIVRSYGLILQAHPALAGLVARDLFAWNDWRYAGEFAELVESPVATNSIDALLIQSYLRRAQAGLSS
jgi:hypothetical protein